MNIKGGPAKAMELAKLYQQESMKEERAKIVQMGKSIINAIKNGIILEDGRVRKFDIVDYYSLTALNFNELVYIIRDDLSVSEIKIIRKFQQAYEGVEPITLEMLFQTRRIYNVEFDEYRRIIPGSGREVTNEEKENIYNLMVSYNLPIINEVYEALLERWKHDFLELPTKFNQDGQTLARKK